MSTAFTTLWDPARLPPLPLHKFSVEDYHRMIKSGVLNEDHRVELLEGWNRYLLDRQPAGRADRGPHQAI